MSSAPEDPSVDPMAAPMGPPPMQTPQTPPPLAIPINEWDDDEQHLLTHEEQQKSPSYRLWPEPNKLEFQSHIDAHKSRIIQRAQGLLPPSTRQLLTLSAGMAMDMTGGDGQDAPGAEGAPMDDGGVSNADFGGGQ
jgi:hypothetical protein